MLRVFANHDKSAMWVRWDLSDICWASDFALPWGTFRRLHTPRDNTRRDDEGQRVLPQNASGRGPCVGRSTLHYTLPILIRPRT